MSSAASPSQTGQVADRQSGFILARSEQSNGALSLPDHSAGPQPITSAHSTSLVGLRLRHAFAAGHTRHIAPSSNIPRTRGSPPRCEFCRKLPGDLFCVRLSSHRRSEGCSVIEGGGGGGRARGGEFYYHLSVSLACIVSNSVGGPRTRPGFSRLLLPRATRSWFMLGRRTDCAAWWPSCSEAKYGPGPENCCWDSTYRCCCSKPRTHTEATTAPCQPWKM